MFNSFNIRTALYDCNLFGYAGHTLQFHPLRERHTQHEIINRSLFEHHAPGE